MYYVGIDLLKILAMIFITILHVVGQGGVLEASHGSANAISWLIGIICYCGVNCYALISGFVGYTGRHRYSRYIYLWFQVVFYCLLMTTIYYFLKPISKEEFVMSLFPVTFNQYWYFTAYTSVFILSPLLNNIVNTFERKNLFKVSIIIFGISCYVTIAKRYSVDPFELKYGYSFVWLSVLYFLGAIVRKYDIHLKLEKKKVGTGIILLVLFTWVWKVWIGKALGHELDWLFVSYVSPTILAISLGLLIWFAGIQLKRTKCISFVATATFGVYLFHVEKLFFKYFMKNRFEFIAEMNVVLLPIVVICSGLIIFIAGVIIDKVRSMIFKIIRIDRLSIKMEEIGREIFSKI